MNREKALTLQGWERRMTLDDPRLSEMAAVYREIGYEVHLEPVHPEEEQGCTRCLTKSPERLRTLYTRKKKPAAGDAGG